MSKSARNATEESILWQQFACIVKRRYQSCRRRNMEISLFLIKVFCGVRVQEKIALRQLKIKKLRMCRSKIVMLGIAATNVGTPGPFFESAAKCRYCFYFWRRCIIKKLEIFRNILGGAHAFITRAGPSVCTEQLWCH